MAKKTKYDQSLPIGVQKLIQLFNNWWAVLATIIGAFWWGYDLGSKHEENKKNIEYFRIESEMQEQQQKELFTLREKILNLEQDLKDCENERKQNEGRGKKISQGDK